MESGSEWDWRITVVWRKRAICISWSPYPSSSIWTVPSSEDTTRIAPLSWSEFISGSPPTIPISRSPFTHCFKSMDATFD